MSYDVYLKDATTGEVLNLPAPHQLTGGTLVVGGTTEAWLNVTYNYGKHIREALHPDGIRWLYGQRARDTIQALSEAILALGVERSDDYWEPTPGNAGAALFDLLTLAYLAPDGIWQGD